MRFLGDWAEARPAARLGTTTTNPPLDSLKERYLSAWRAHPMACEHVDPEGGTTAFMLPWFKPPCVLCAHCTYRVTSSIPPDDPENMTCDDCREVGTGLYQVIVQSSAVVIYLYLCDRCYARIDVEVEEEIPAS